MNIKKVFPEKLKKRVRIIKSNIGEVRYGFPSRKVKLIGVTGTSGKSTTSMLIYHLLEEAGIPTGVISTVGAKAGRKMLDTGLHVTTPNPMELKKILKFMADRGCKYVVVEASSHALAQGRLGNLKFDHSVYTNIKRDHLDWHLTWENYAASKATLGLMTKSTGSIIVNRDDKEGYEFLRNFFSVKGNKSNLVTYSVNEIRGIKEESKGIYFQIGEDYFYLPLLGKYNIENTLAAITLANILGISNKQIAKSLKDFRGVTGRMQVLKSEPFQVIVNFAHNTDSLVRSLESAQKLKSFKGRVIVVFGSAGLRDVEKRYTMGEAAAKHANIVVVTAEDPRTESLYDINSQIIEGADREGGVLQERFSNTEEYKQYLAKTQDSNFEIPNKAVYAFDQETVDSRYDAIDFAIKIARPGDIVITEGKGHEQSLCFGTTEFPFTDQEAVLKSIEMLK